MHYFLEQLTAGGRTAAGWYGWYALHKATAEAPRTLIGAGGFTGPPNEEGMAEIGYSIAADWRRMGLATEPGGRPRAARRRHGHGAPAGGSHRPRQRGLAGSAAPQRLCARGRGPRRPHPLRAGRGAGRRCFGGTSRRSVGPPGGVLPRDLGSQL
ncbi:GNAT family N-acetyltransferase [Hymenobacter humi]|uniref:GNAT family N-acetyltransferase n=1 Tax=Hymenobacter humi TaxID=1411620 RepID=A0ABW2TYV4_9BACT